MSDVPPGDWQRWQDEIQRCNVLSVTTVTAPAPPERTAQMRRARYYADRARVLYVIGPERAVAFLREEALRALAGEPPENNLSRWFRLHSLEFGGLKPGATMSDIMGLGVEKLVAEGVADQIAEAHRERWAADARRRSTMSCTWCQGNNGCNGACM